MRGKRSHALKRKPSSAGPTASQAEAQLRVLHALALMRREGLSLSAATTRARGARRTTLKYGREALRKRAGRYRVLPTDRYEAWMQFPTEKGAVALPIRGARARGRLSRFWAAVDRYLTTGDASRLRPFRGRAIHIGGVRYPFLTDLTTLDRLANAGEVSFESLYETTA